MNLIERAFNAAVVTFGWVSRIEPTSKAVLDSEKAHRKILDETLSYRLIKAMIRSDAEERVRIVQCGEDFGAVVDFDDPKCGWSPQHILGGGIIYEYAAAAGANARSVLAWVKDGKEVPV